MRTENHFFDNYAIRIIIAVLTSTLGVLLIEGIYLLYGYNVYPYVEIFEIIGWPLMIILLIVCVRHRIGICLFVSLMWLFLAITDVDVPDILFLFFVNPVAPLMDIDVSIMIAIISKEKLKIRMKGEAQTATEEKSKVNVKRIKAAVWNCFLSIATPCILVRLSDVFYSGYEITNAQAMGIFAFVLVSYIFVLMIQLVVCKRQKIFLWNYGYILLVIAFISFILGFLGLHGEANWGILIFLEDTSWPTFTTVAFVELFFTIYVNYLKSRQERF